MRMHLDSYLCKSQHARQFRVLATLAAGHCTRSMFSNGFLYDYNISSVTTSCQLALSGKVGCTWRLVFVDTDSIKISAYNQARLSDIKEPGRR
jgi:hypothetical protein